MKIHKKIKIGIPETRGGGQSNLKVYTCVTKKRVFFCSVLDALRASRVSKTLIFKKKGGLKYWSNLFRVTCFIPGFCSPFP